MAGTLRCIACRTQLQNIMEHEGHVQPVDGLAFSSRGHYGSTVFDPMDGSHLVIVVCDACLAGAATDDIVWEVRAQPVRYRMATPWRAPTPPDTEARRPGPADTEEA